MKRLICVMLALALVCTGAFAESSVLTLFDTARELAYDTDNVTLSCNATLSLDGELFKTVRASYKQDGYNSYLDYMLDTVKTDGSTYTGGYGVVGIGSTAYACDTFFGNYYTMHNCSPENTVLSAGAQDTAMLDVVRQMLSIISPAETASGDGAASHYAVTDLPDYVGSTLFYLLRDYLYNHYYIYAFSAGNTMDDYVCVYYEDWAAFIGSLYYKLYNEEMPATLEDQTAADRYDVACTWADQIVSEAESQYVGGYMLVRADGTCEWYADEADCMRAGGIVNLYMRDEYGAVSAYYEATYGTPLTRDVWTIAAMYTPNAELNNAYYSLYQDCYNYYIQKALEQDPDAVYVMVDTDGTIKPRDTMTSGVYISVTRELMGEVMQAHLDKLDADVTLDESGRLSKITGTAAVTLTYADGSTHVLDVTFDLGAAGYGTTHVNEDFDPAEYGWVTYNEYQEQHAVEDTCEPDWNAFVQTAPDTVEFMGRTYDTGMSAYREN